MTNQNVENPLQEVDQLALEVCGLRNKPLLILYYPEKDGMITHFDVRDIHDEFKRRGWSRDRMIEELDVLLHTYGGDPDGAYRIGQVIRDFAKKVNFLIPFHAHSGGTLTCFSADKIVLGAYAVLGPIDITVDGIELASIDYYIQFAQNCRKTTEQMLHDFIRENLKGDLPVVNPEPSTDVERYLLCEMVKQVGALNVGRFFRERTLTGHYAYRLLYDYMFATNPNKESLCGKIANAVLFEFPSHDFDMDYHICKDVGLPVYEMNETESDKTKLLVNRLDELVEREVICRQLTDEYKAPFFRLYNIGEHI
jgi:hypothetical protein